jgi:hypothetical protein
VLLGLVFRASETSAQYVPRRMDRVAQASLKLNVEGGGSGSSRDGARNNIWCSCIYCLRAPSVGCTCSHLMLHEQALVPCVYGFASSTMRRGGAARRLRTHVEERDQHGTHRAAGL